MKTITLKNHPVITITLLFAFGAACVTAGWVLRTMMESRAELAVVVDDGKFDSAMKTTLIAWGDAFNLWEGEFRYDHTAIPDCLAQPMPNYYHDNDYELQPAWE